MGFCARGRPGYDPAMPMVDVSSKAVVRRTARATGVLTASAETIRRIGEGTVPKGNVLETARAAALLAIKQTPHLLPMCHPIAVTGADVSFTLEGSRLEIAVEVRADDKTGVEMEALTAACVAGLCVYDMCKGIDKGMALSEIRLAEKSKTPIP